eukprot:3689348-Pleurochrysis_carterae.AAC.2
MDRLARELEPADQCVPIRVDLTHTDPKGRRPIPVATMPHLCVLALVLETVEIVVANCGCLELKKLDFAAAHIRRPLPGRLLGMSA